jgi:large subunit ribosomal protein L9
MNHAPQILKGRHFMPATEVILIENVPGLGAEADVVKVKAGYARNFLFPRHMALEVSPTALKKINQLKAKRAEREARELNESEELARKINKLKATLTLATGETGKAFGSITASDIAAKIKEELGVEIDRHSIQLERPIKSTGDHEVEIKLAHEVTAKLNLTVKSDSTGETGGAEEAAASEEKGFKARPKARHTAK